MFLPSYVFMVLLEKFCIVYLDSLLLFSLKSHFIQRSYHFHLYRYIYIYINGVGVCVLWHHDQHFAKQQAADLPVSCWNRNQWQILDPWYAHRLQNVKQTSKQFLFPGIPVQYLCPVLRSQHKSRKDSEIKTQKDFLLLTEFQNESVQSWIIPNELWAQHTSQNRTFTHTQSERMGKTGCWSFRLSKMHLGIFIKLVTSAL